jgi:hypothetical protein
MNADPATLRRSGRRLVHDASCALRLGALVVFAACPPHPLAAAEPATSNRPPRLVVAVLPFENATGDAALDDWRRALPTLMRSCLGSAEFLSLPGWKKIEPSLTHAGWTDAKALEPEVARQVAHDLKAGFAVWGSFQRQTNGWALEVSLLRTDRSASTEEIRLVEPNPVKLADSIARRLAAQWDRALADDTMERWRMVVTQNDTAAGKLAHALALELREAPPTEQEQAWREVIGADPRCGMAYSALIDLLTDAGQDAEISNLVEQHVRLQPRSCAAHAANGYRLLIVDDQAGAEAEMREALRLHPSCSKAVRVMFKLLANSGRWAELVAILKPAHASQPNAESIRIFLSLTRNPSGSFWRTRWRRLAITTAPGIC